MLTSLSRCLLKLYSSLVSCFYLHCVLDIFNHFFVYYQVGVFVFLFVVLTVTFLPLVRSLAAGRYEEFCYCLLTKFVLFSFNLRLTVNATTTSLYEMGLSGFSM